MQNSREELYARVRGFWRRPYAENFCIKFKKGTTKRLLIPNIIKH